MSVHVYVCVWVRDRQTESAKSYNSGSVLQAQSPVPTPLIQHTHCTFSRSMIPLCLTHTQSLSSHPHTCTNALHSAHTQTHIHSVLLISTSPSSCSVSHIYVLSYTLLSFFLSIPPSLWSPEQLLMETLERSKRERERGGSICGKDRGMEEKRRSKCRMTVNENSLSLNLRVCCF